MGFHRAVTPRAKTLQRQTQTPICLYLSSITPAIQSPHPGIWELSKVRFPHTPIIKLSVTFYFCPLVPKKLCNLASSIFPRTLFSILIPTRFIFHPPLLFFPFSEAVAIDCITWPFLLPLFLAGEVPNGQGGGTSKRVNTGRSSFSVYSFGFSLTSVPEFSFPYWLC